MARTNNVRTLVLLLAVQEGVSIRLNELAKGRKLAYKTAFKLLTNQKLVRHR